MPFELTVTVSIPSVDAFDEELVMLTLTLLPDVQVDVLGDGPAAADSLGIRLSKDSTDRDLLDDVWLCSALAAAARAALDTLPVIALACRLTFWRPTCSGDTLPVAAVE